MAMLKRRLQRPRPLGAAVVEMAFVAPIAFLFMLAVFEYGRLFMVMHVLDHAAREGARYAVVNIDFGSLQGVRDTVNGALSRLNGPGSKVTVQPATAFWLNYGSPPGATPTEATPYNNAQFGQSIGVRIQATYYPVVPVFLRMNQQISLTSVAYMCSEAN